MYLRNLHNLHLKN